jgi:hypothetical protein
MSDERQASDDKPDDSEPSAERQAELRTALLRRQADLQRQIAGLRRHEHVPANQVENAANLHPSDAGDSSVDLQD